MTDQEQIRRAEQAKAILESNLWLEMWEDYRGKLIAAFTNSPIEQRDYREYNKLLYEAMQHARDYMESVMKNGAFAQESKRLDELRRIKDWRQ